MPGEFRRQGAAVPASAPGYLTFGRACLGLRWFWWLVSFAEQLLKILDVFRRSSGELGLSSSRSRCARLRPGLPDEPSGLPRFAVDSGGERLTWGNCYRSSTCSDAFLTPPLEDPYPLSLP